MPSVSDNPRRESMLEISCGSHSDLYEKSGSDWKIYIGIDIDLSRCRIARKQGIEVVCCDAFNLPFKWKSLQDIYIQCFTALMNAGAYKESFDKSGYDDFCEFMEKQTDFEFAAMEPFYDLIRDCRHICYEKIICLPSCETGMNKYLVNAVKNIPFIKIDADYKKKWGSKKNICVMFLEIDCR